MKLTFFSIFILMLSGCVSIEEQCYKAVNEGRTYYPNVQQCIQGEYEKQARASAALQQSAQSFQNLNRTPTNNTNQNCTVTDLGYGQKSVNCQSY